jgi:hypothetical protein
LDLNEIIPPLLVNEKKGGQIRCAFANPVLGKVEDIHSIESDGRKKGQFFPNGKALRGLMSFSVETYGLFPNTDEFLLKIDVHRQKENVADRSGCKSL